MFLPVNSQLSPLSTFWLIKVQTLVDLGEFQWMDHYHNENYDQSLKFLLLGREKKRKDIDL